MDGVWAALLPVLEGVTVAAFLSAANERIVEAFGSPLFKRFGWDTTWLLYVTLVTGGALSLVARLNVFDGFIGNWWVGWVLTAFAVGGGAELFHQVVGLAKRSAR